MSGYEITSPFDIDVGTLQAAVRHRSFDAMSGVLGWIFGLIENEFPDFRVKGCKVLEIGTGKFLNHPLGMIACGCEEVVTIDTERQLHMAAVKIAMGNPVLARRFLSSQSDHDTFMTKMCKMNNTHLELSELEMLGLTYVAPFDYSTHKEYDGKFDIVFSYTVLEHVYPEEINDFLDFSLTALKEGAYFFHFVDLEDHKGSTENPFDFFQDNEWCRMDCINRGNRLRLSTWKKIFLERDNINCRYPYIAVRNDIPLPLVINNKVYAESDEDLRTTAFLVVGKKLSDNEQNYCGQF